MTPGRSASRSMVTAMLCAGAVTAQFVGGKATRDALFLASLDFTALPAIVIATAVFSIVLVLANSRVARRVSPAKLVPALFFASGVLFFVEWLLNGRAPKVIAIAAYLHISGAGPLLGSSFWLISSERFDPHTAKQRFGQIASAGTLGGLLAAALAERVAGWLGVAAMLPVLGALHLVSAWLVRDLAIEAGEPRMTASEARSRGTMLSGWRVVTRTPYLRQLGILVLLGTTGAALMDYIFKAEAVRTFGRGDNLLRFFAIYYAGTSLLTFVVQATSSRVVLERVGLAFATATPSVALLSGSIGGLIWPGFNAAVAARAGESVFRGSLYRAGYELFYTPFPAAEKRAAKSIIDVGFDRLGDAVGGGLVRLALFVPLTSQHPVIFGLAIVCSAIAIVAASSLNRGYIRTLERSLLNRAVEIDLSEVEDLTTRTLMTRTLELGRSGIGARQPPKSIPPSSTLASMSSVAIDPDVQDILRLRSGDRDRVVEVLRREEGLSPVLVPHAIPLLAWDPVARDALFALRKVAEERAGQLADALIDPNQDFAVRRRLARVFSVCVSQRASDGVMMGLDDLRFEVRYHCGHSLSAIMEKNPRVRIDGERIMTVVLREVAVGRPMWESRRLLDEFEPFEGASFVDEFVRDRAGQSLAHVFTLLSLVLPREPLQIAFKSLQTNDQQLQGTALEYLEGVLPPQIRRRLWPFLEDRRSAPAAKPERPRDEILADLLRSQHSIMLNLEELKRRAANEGAAESVKQAGTPRNPNAQVDS